MAKIVAADFNHVIPGLVKKCLQPLGHEVFTAYHGHAAVEIWSQVHPDLLITGVMLPGIDGYGLVRKWRAIDGKTRPALMVVGKGQTLDEMLIGQLGVTGVIRYPFKSSELIELVGRSLEDTVEMEDVLDLEATTPVVSIPPPTSTQSPGHSPTATKAGLAGLKESLLKDGLLDAAGAGATVASPPRTPASRPPLVRPPAPSRPLSGPPFGTAADPGDQLRRMLNAKFQEVTDLIVRSLPDIVERIVDEKLKKR